MAMGCMDVYKPPEPSVASALAEVPNGKYCERALGEKVATCGQKGELLWLRKFIQLGPLTGAPRVLLKQLGAMCPQIPWPVNGFEMQKWLPAIRFLSPRSFPRPVEGPKVPRSAPLAPCGSQAARRLCLLRADVGASGPHGSALQLAAEQNFPTVRQAEAGGVGVQLAVVVKTVLDPILVGR